MTNPSETRDSELLARLRNGARYLSRTALQGSQEAKDFFNAGDSIAVNEGDFWILLSDAKEAADTIDRLTSTGGLSALTKVTRTLPTDGRLRAFTAVSFAARTTTPPHAKGM